MLAPVQSNARNFSQIESAHPEHSAALQAFRCLAGKPRAISVDSAAPLMTALRDAVQGHTPSDLINGWPASTFAEVVWQGHWNAEAQMACDIKNDTLRSIVRAMSAHFVKSGHQDVADLLTSLTTEF